MASISCLVLRETFIATSLNTTVYIQNIFIKLNKCYGLNQLHDWFYTITSNYKNAIIIEFLKTKPMQYNRYFYASGKIFIP